MTAARDRFCEELKETRERFEACNISDPALTVCIAGLARIEEVLRRPAKIVILGEYNSGKTSVADLLIGDGLLPTGVISNTRVPVMVSHAPAAALYGIDRNATRIRIDDTNDPLTDLPYRAIHLTLPLAWLKDYQILDTPALAAPTAFIADADIVVWCTVASRAWTESERVQWTSLPQRCYRNALLVCTHKDSVHTEEECQDVMNRLKYLTQGYFRDIVLVDAANTQPTSGSSQAAMRDRETARLREAIEVSANAIFERRLKKANQIVRRLARLTFHNFGKASVRAESISLISSWEQHAASLVQDCKSGRRSEQATIEALLSSYATYAEKLRPGVVTGNAIPHSQAHAIAVPARWPTRHSAALYLISVLVSDLTGLLRVLAGSSSYVDPRVRAEHRAIRASMLALADIDGSFDALGQMLGASPLKVGEHRV